MKSKALKNFVIIAILLVGVEIVNALFDDLKTTSQNDTPTKDTLIDINHPQKHSRVKRQYYPYGYGYGRYYPRTVPIPIIFGGLGFGGGYVGYGGGRGFGGRGVGGQAFGGRGFGGGRGGIGGGRGGGRG